MKKKIILILLVCLGLKVEAQTSTFSRIDSLLEKGRYNLALTQLKKIDTLQDISNYKIGSIYASIDDNKKAIEYYQKSLSFKESFRIQLSLAKAYQKEKEYVNSIQIYETLLQTNTENLIITYELGKLYVSVNDFEKAVKVFKKLSIDDLTNPNYHYQLGLIAGRKSDGNGMIDHFLRAYKSDTTHVNSVYQLAKTFSLLRKRDSSRLFTDIGLQLDNLHISLNKLKINEHFRNNRFKEAIVRLKILDSITPDDLYTKKMLGRTYFSIDSLDLAETNFKMAMKLDPEDFKILTYLGHIYKAKKEYRFAMFSYLRATTVEKKSRHEEYYSLGMLYLETEETSKAIEMFKRSIKESDRVFKVLYQLALTSDSYYKDKNIANELYKDYINRFEFKDKEITAFVKNRMKEIKKELFMNVEKVEE